MRNIFRYGKYFFAGEKINRGKGGNNWRGKICFFSEEMNNRERKEGSFARGWSIQMIICNRLFNPDDHLQKASPSR